MSVLQVGAGVRPDRDADFAAYMTARQPGLLRFAFLMTGDPHLAEDVVAAALTRLYLSWSRIETSPDAYARRIVVNEVNAVWRRPWRRRELTTGVLPELAATGADEGRDAELWAAVSALPPRQRAVVVLRYYEGLSEAEIAEALDVAPGTVKSQASKAIASLRTALGPTHGTPEVE